MTDTSTVTHDSGGLAKSLNKTTAPEQSGAFVVRGCRRVGTPIPLLSRSTFHH